MKPETQTYIFVVEDDKKYITIETTSLEKAIQFVEAYANGRKYHQVIPEPIEPNESESKA
jgi:hypothetical protein